MRSLRPAALAALVAAVWVATADAQAPKPVRLNRIIEKLEQNRPVIGVSSMDRSLENAQFIARSTRDDYVMINMESSSNNIETLRTFLLGMIDKRSLVKKGNLQPNVTPVVKYWRDPTVFEVTQALDVGIMGIMFADIGTPAQALHAVRAMRYPQARGARDAEPRGLRGQSNRNAVWWWGVSEDDYFERADLWPLDPNGELLAVMIIESGEGVKNVDEIARVPGVGAIFIGTSDLSADLGVKRPVTYYAGGEELAPEVEAAVQVVLKTCLARKIPCGIGVNKDNQAKRLEQGFRLVDPHDAR